MTVEALPATKRVELIDKKEFAVVAINKKSEIFVVYNTALEVSQLRLAEILIKCFRIA